MVAQGPQPTVSPWPRRIFYLCLVLSTLFGFSMLEFEVTTNSASRFATIDALVHDGSFAIERSPFTKRTIDKVMIEGQLLSSKPPVLSTLGALIYGGLYLLTGASLSSDVPGYAIYGTNPGMVMAMSGILGLIPHLILLVYGHRCLRRLGVSPAVHGFTLFALSFSYLGLSYATTVNNHTFAALALTATIYHLLVCAQGQRPSRAQLVYAGLWAGLLPTLELPGLAFSGVALLFCFRQWPRLTLRYFVPGLVLWACLHFTLTYAASGGFKPVYLVHRAYEFAGSPWLNRQGIDNLDEPKLLYSFHALFGHKGWFSITPLVLLGFAGLWQELRRSQGRALEALFLFGLALFALLCFVLLRTNNYGGVCVGMRWLIFVSPALLLLMARFLGGPGSRPRLRWALASIGFVVGFIHASDALYDGPWRRGLLHQAFFEAGYVDY